MLHDHGRVVKSRRLSDMRICCHDLGVMSSNPGRLELGVLGTSVLSRT